MVRSTSKVVPCLQPVAVQRQELSKSSTMLSLGSTRLLYVLTSGFTFICSMMSDPDQSKAVSFDHSLKMLYPQGKQFFCNLTKIHGSETFLPTSQLF